MVNCVFKMKIVNFDCEIVDIPIYNLFASCNICVIIIRQRFHDDKTSGKIFLKTLSNEKNSITKKKNGKKTLKLLQSKNM